MCARTRRLSIHWPLLLLVATLPTAAGCGFGTIGAALGLSAGGGGGGGTDLPATLTGFSLEGTQAPPATLRFTLLDPESEPTPVELRLRIPDGSGGETDVLLTELSQGGTPQSNPQVLGTSPSGIEHVFDWNFTAQAGLPTDGSLIEGVTVYALVPGVLDDIFLGTNAVQSGVGNNPPAVSGVNLPSEAGGVLGIPFLIEDSAGDLVSVRIEFDIQGDTPDAGFQLVTPQFFGSPPPFAVVGVAASEAGTPVTFAWDTGADLTGSEFDVVLRLTPDDGLVEGTPVVTEAVRIDNSSVPTATIDGGGLLASSDSRRGIGIPYRVSDAESDRVRVVFQWRDPSGFFPTLPTSSDDLEELLADPVQRTQAQIATPFPLRALGAVEVVDESNLRLTGLNREAPWFVTQGLEGRQVALRSGRISPTQVTSSWPTTTLDQPVGVLPGSSSDRFLILDSGPLGWRLRDLQVATGEGPTVGTGEGTPTAMALEASGDSILLGTVQAGDWVVTRVQLSNGVSEELLAGSAPLPSGPIRGIAARGPNGAVITVADALLSLDLRPGAPGLARVVSQGLSEPSGVVLMPGSTDRVLLAERSFDPGSGPTGRLLSIHLRRATREVFPLFLPDAPSVGTPDLLRPGAIAFDETGSRLLLSGERATDLARGVFEFSVGAQGQASGSLLTAFGADASAVSFGPFGARWVTFSALGQVAAGSGVRVLAEVNSYDSGSEVATLAEPLTVFPQTGDQWAVELADQPFVRATPGGSPATFVWDSSDIEPGASALFRATPYDIDEGTNSATTGAKLIVDNYDVSPLITAAEGGSATNQSPALKAGDIDGDGDLDMVGLFLGGAPNLEVFLQDGARDFSDGFPIPSSPDSVGPTDIDLVDVDLDGDLDLVTANFGSDNFTIYRQASDGTFELDSRDVLGSAVDTPDPFAVESADVDADGIPEILAAHSSGTELYVSGAGGAGVFASTRTFDSSLSEPRAVDANRDGLTDILLAAFLNSGAQAYLATSPGVFEADPVEVSSTPGYPAREVLAADFGGGSPDLIHDDSSARLTYSPTGPDGSFGPNQDLPIPPGAGGFQPGELAVADLDRDGRTDLIVAESGSPQAGLLRSSGVQTFASPTVIGPAASLVSLPTSAGALSVRDLDGDGFADVSLGSGAAWNQQHSVRPGEFTSSVTQALSFGNAPRQVVAGDLDGDGDLDLVISNSGGPPALRIQRAPTQFDSSFLPDAAQFVAADRIALADLDADGDLDILHASGTQLVLRFQENGDFPSSLAVILQDSRFSFGNVEGTNLVCGDLDLNGELDLVFAAPDRDSVFVLLQEGGVFDTTNAQELADPALLTDPRQIALFDFNLDGRLDLVIADLVQDALVFFTNTPSGFSSANAFQLSSPSANLLEICDLDGDGRADLIANEASASSIRVRFQAFDGTFGSVTTVPIPEAPGGNFSRAIRCADVDQDGRMDLVVKINQRLVVLRQGATRRFTTAAPGLLPLGAPSTNLPSEALEVVDLDGDGDLDLVAGGLNGQALGVLYGAH